MGNEQGAAAPIRSGPGMPGPYGCMGFGFGAS